MRINEKTSKEVNPLPPEFFFALFVYRLIVATLIGNFFDNPFLN